MASMVSGIQGQLLEVTVIGCSRLKNTEWISRQDPYVCLEYGSTKFRTRTHTDGGKNPVFQEKFAFSLIEGLRDLKVLVWNSNTLSSDNLIGSGTIQLQRVLSQGFDDTPCPLYGKDGRTAGEVRLVMHYSQVNKPATSYSPYGASHSPHVSPYSVPPPSTASYAHPTASYPAPSPYPTYPPAPAAYPPLSTAYPPPYAPPPVAYPPVYPQHSPQSTAYPPPYAPPPAAYPPTYPQHPPQSSAYPQLYAPLPSAYPPTYPNSGTSYYAPGPYHGAYQPPPY